MSRNRITASSSSFSAWGGGGDAQVTVAEPPYQNPAVAKQRIHPTRVLQPHIDKIGAAVVNPFDQSVLFQPPEPAKQPVPGRDEKFTVDILIDEVSEYHVCHRLGDRVDVIRGLRRP